MTQTPREFEPHDPNDAETPRYPESAPAASGPAVARNSAEPPATDSERASAPVTIPATPATPPEHKDTPLPQQPEASATAAEPRRVTRAGMVWAAVAAALVVLILLIAFILQNQEYVLVKFFGLEGSVPLGIALFIAAVGGGVLVAIAGAARIIQLRLAAHRQRVGRRAGTGTHTR
ncbi:putative integral membrane protein [Arthrobacter sp. UYCu512]|uniref:LapA family protein n=1 Tax=Arthrobacter sp. UYCu512 TaxID=3156338 RepID=UPI003398546C